MSSMERVEPGTRIDISVGIPFIDSSPLPAAQLDGVAVVVRSEPADPHEDDEFAANIAMRFLQPLTVSAELSMFD